MFYKLPNDGYYTVICDYCGVFMYKTENPPEKLSCQKCETNGMGRRRVGPPKPVADPAIGYWGEVKNPLDRISPSIKITEIHETQ